MFHHIAGFGIMIIVTCVTLTSCATPEPGGRVEFREVLKPVRAPCPVTKPTPPAPLAKPLPTSPARLVDLLTAKLLELMGPGGYVERSSAALDICTKP